MKEYATKCLGNLVRSASDTDQVMFKPLIPLIFKVGIMNFKICNFFRKFITVMKKLFLHVFETLCGFNHKSLSFFKNILYSFKK